MVAEPWATCAAGRAGSAAAFRADSARALIDVLAAAVHDPLEGAADETRKMKPETRNGG